MTTPQSLCKCGHPHYLHHNLTPHTCMKTACPCSAFVEARTNFDDVVAFHEKFGVPVGDKPRLLNQKDYNFRLGFMEEELREFREAHAAGDLAGAADALIDLAYVTFGCAAWMGLPWQELWDDVQRANMSKVSARYQPEGARHSHDVRKPEGWVPPKTEEILQKAVDKDKGFSYGDVSPRPGDNE